MKSGWSWFISSGAEDPHLKCPSIQPKETPAPQTRSHPSGLHGLGIISPTFDLVYIGKRLLGIQSVIHFSFIVTFHSSCTTKRILLNPFPFDSVFTTSILPTCEVDETWVPPSACLSRPTISTILISLTDSGTRLTFVLIRSRSSTASSRAKKETSICLSAVSYTHLTLPTIYSV